MSCPGTYPTVLNGQIYYNDSTTAEYECLSGFYMTGNKRITCSTGVWQTAPTCHVIEQADDVFPDWWLIVGAIVLCLLVLICFICVVCYFCCSSGRVVDNTIYPVTNRFSDGCCGSRSGCCRSGCCGRENGCCTCLRGGCACAQGCCTSGTGCCLLGGSGTCCCCCCGQSGKKGRGKKKGVKAGQGNTGKWKGTGATLGDDGQAPSSVITTPPRSHATVAQSPARTEKKTTKTPPPAESTTPPGGHYVSIPASDGDVKNSSPAHHNPKVHSHSHTVYHTSHGSVGPAHGAANHAHGHNSHAHGQNSHAHGHNSHAHGHNSHAYIVHSPPVPASGNVTPCSCCGPIGPGNGRSGWILVQDAMHQDRLRHSEDLHLEVLETRSDGDVEQQKPAKTKKPPAKEVKGWLPHSHPVRTINTSTK